MRTANPILNAKSIKKRFSFAKSESTSRARLRHNKTSEREKKRKKRNARNVYDLNIVGGLINKAIIYSDLFPSSPGPRLSTNEDGGEGVVIAARHGRKRAFELTAPHSRSVITEIARKIEALFVLN